MNKKTIIGLILGTILFGSVLTPNNKTSSSVTTRTIPTTTVIEKATKPTVPNTESVAPTITPTTPSVTTTTDSKTYTNVDGNKVQSPTYYPENNVPSGATAKCRDGTYSFSQHRSGTCSHHGGVAQWL